MKKIGILLFMLLTIHGMVNSRPANTQLLPERYEQKLTAAFEQAGHIEHAERFISYSHRLFGGIPGSQASSHLVTTPYTNEMINSLWDNNSWVNQEKEVHVYNSDDLNTETYSWNWNNNQWVYSSLMVLGYDAQERPVSMLMKTWDGSQSSWNDFLKITITYSSGNNPSEWLAEFNLGGIWVNVLRYIFTYNMQGQWTEVLQQEYDMMGLTWQDAVKTQYTYDSSGNLSIRLTMEWNGSTWDDQERSLHTFNSSGYETETISEEWFGSWVPYNRSTYTYDGQWNRIHMLYEWWTGSAWENGAFTTRTFDGQNRLTVELRQIWNSAWENNEMDQWTYNLPVGIEKPELTKVSGMVYPNPAINHLNISFELSEALPITVYIHDISGREFQHHRQGQFTAGSHHLVVPVSHLPAGSYLVTLRSVNRVLLQERLMVVR